MTDRYDPELLLDYVEGELSQDRRAAVEALLAQDGQLQQLVEGMRRDREALRSLPRPSAPPRLIEQANLQLERRMLLDPADDAGRQGAARSFRFYRTAVYTAMAAVVLVSAAVLYQAVMPGNVWEEANRLEQPLALQMSDQRQPPLAPPPEEAEPALAGRAIADRGAGVTGASSLARSDSTPERNATADADTQAEAVASGPAEARIAKAVPAALAAATADRTGAAHAPEGQVAPGAQRPAPGEYFVKLRGSGDEVNRVATAVVTATQPSEVAPRVAALQLNVRAADPESARREVVAWATANRAQVVCVSDAKTATDWARQRRAEGEESVLAQRLAERWTDEADGRAATNADRADKPAAKPGLETAAADDAARDDAQQDESGRERELVLVLADDQVAGLVAHLNSFAAQRAALEPASALGDASQARRLHAAVRNVVQSQARPPQAVTPLSRDQAMPTPPLVARPMPETDKEEEASSPYAWTGPIDWTATLMRQLPSVAGDAQAGANAALDAGSDLGAAAAGGTVILPVAIVADTEAAGADGNGEGRGKE